MLWTVGISSPRSLQICNFLKISESTLVGGKGLIWSTAPRRARGREPPPFTTIHERNYVYDVPTRSTLVGRCQPPPEHGSLVGWLLRRSGQLVRHREPAARPCSGRANGRAVSRYGSSTGAGPQSPPHLRARMPRRCHRSPRALSRAPLLTHRRSISMPLPRPPSLPLHRRQRQNDLTVSPRRRSRS